MLHFKPGEIIQFLKRYEKEQLMAFGGIVLVLILAITYLVQLTIKSQQHILLLSSEKEKATTAFQDLKKQDQYKINQQLKDDVKKTHDGYANSISLYEKIVDLRAQKQDTSPLDKLYASVIKELSDLKYGSAESDLKD